MDVATSLLGVVNLFFAVVIGMYFLNLLKVQQGNKVAVERESRKEMDKLQRLRAISLSEPLSERTRPTAFSDIIGQSEGIRALRAALCGPNPQHVIVYGPPGIGKTAAARIVLEEAKRSPHSPFRENSRFIEVDATTARFDDRGIADPLMGSVHDPIYQGAGPLGMAGIPQPKAGAVTKAHGGVLFIDEIGELHPVQMNKLLKVLEDRKVFLESAYYSSEDASIPSHIHDIFQNGLPADFRLVGATTRLPQEIPPAIRSRCVEVFFRDLSPEEIACIATNAAKKVEFELEDGALDVIAKFAANGRDSVNIVQIAAGVAFTEGRRGLTKGDIEWVVNAGQYSPRVESKIGPTPQVGVVNGLAVYGPNQGSVMEIEVTAIPVGTGTGKLTTTGLIDEEEMSGMGKTMRRKSMARGSVDNVLTALRGCTDIEPGDYDIHVNFPGGMPVDGPSAGVSMAVAIYSAVKGVKVDNCVAMTGEISIRGNVLPVGGIVAKVGAAGKAGVRRILIPRGNWQESFSQDQSPQVIPVDHLSEAIALAGTGPSGSFAPDMRDVVSLATAPAS